MSQLAAGESAAAELRDGVDALVQVAGPEAAPAVLLAALLKAAGERAQLDYARDLVFVKVEIDPADAARLPRTPPSIVARRRGAAVPAAVGAPLAQPDGVPARSTREGLARRRFIA